MKGKTYHINIDSLTSLANIADKTQAKEMSRIGDDAFAGCSFDEALHYARHGWSEGVTRAKRMLDRMPHKFTEPVSKTVYDVSGAYVDVGAYVEGVPECMVDFTTDERTKRFAHIVISASYAGIFTVEQAITRGVAIAAVIDSLESQSIRCDVDLCLAARGYDGELSYINLPVKRASDVLNLDTLTFAVAHPAYLRRLLFAIMEQQGEEYREAFNIRHNGGYGRVGQPPKPDGAIVFPSPDAQTEIWDETDALARVNKVLTQFAKGDA